MKKAITIVLFGLVIFFAAIFGLKFFILHMQKKMLTGFQHPIVTVSAIPASTQAWTSSLTAVGSLQSVVGVNVTTELPGMITDVLFRSGTQVQKGVVLVKLDIAPDIAKLHELQARATLSEITYKRNKKQYAFGAVSKETLDIDYANFLSAAAEVEVQQATINKKIIRAPFSGRLGISLVNPGQYLNSGDQVVTLQTLNPIYVDFYVPEQEIQHVFVGQSIELTSDRVPGVIFKGEVTTINPIAKQDIRNVEVQATIPNDQEHLLPGMFANVVLHYGNPTLYITLPSLAITFNPYGALVFILRKTQQSLQGKTVWQATQQFVDTGETRGNQVAVIKGVKAGDMVVTSGQMKLKNGSLVLINNTLDVSNSANPTVISR